MKCKQCNNDIPEKRTYCSVKCKSDYQRGKTLEEIVGTDKAFLTKEKLSKSCSGSKNGNFGNKWTDEQKEIQSIRAKQVYIDKPELLVIVGNSNRGIKWDDERRNDFSNQTKGHKGIIHTEEAKEKIGITSKERANNPEYKKKIRKSMELNGHWIPLENKTDYEIYFKNADWIEKMFDFITDEKQLYKLKTLKVFNCKTNTKGIVRDHMLSRRTGFEQNIPYQLLRHPCNCQILTHSENIKKKNGRYTDKDNQTINELIKKIETYEKDWMEQEMCLEIIKNYERDNQCICGDI